MRNQDIFAVVMGCGLVVGGISLAVSSLHLIPIANASGDWIATDGQITYSQVYIRVIGEYEDKVFCGPEVRYPYRVQEQVYTANRISFNSSESCSQTEEEQYSPRYAVGSQVVVYYDPEQPSLAVLEPGSCVECYFQVVAEPLMALIGFFFLRDGLIRNHVELPPNDPYRSISSRRKMASCPYCGKSIPEDAIDCLHCGREVYDALHNRQVIMDLIRPGALVSYCKGVLLPLVGKERVHETLFENGILQAADLLPCRLSKPMFDSQLAVRRQVSGNSAAIHVASSADGNHFEHPFLIHRRARVGQREATHAIPE